MGAEPDPFDGMGMSLEDRIERRCWSQARIADKLFTNREIEFAGLAKLPLQLVFVEANHE